MKTSKHTQGPWTVGDCFNSGAIDIRSESQEICLLRSEVRENQKANAALIAAAPEMLDSLSMIAIWADKAARDIGSSARRGDQSRADDFRAIRDLATKTIRKARGE